VGTTPFCVEPVAARTCERVGGPKNPDIEAIRRLGPDLVIASVEENRKEDVEALTGVGIPVYVAFPRTVKDGIRLVRNLGGLLGRGETAAVISERLEAERAAVAADAAASGPPVRVFCPIWKEPWMTFSGDTFVNDMLATAGGGNIFASARERYPVVKAEMLAGLRPEVVLLPSEPYRFGPEDLPCVEGLLQGTTGERAAVRFIDGQALTWYGPRIGWGLRLLRTELVSARAERGSL
jgi:ABC-type Fe3+-hydroxamate transport system substrate-binding protein